MFTYGKLESLKQNSTFYYINDRAHEKELVSGFSPPVLYI